MDRRSRLLILLALLAAAMGLAVSSDPTPSPPVGAPRPRAPSRYVPSKPVPAVRSLPELPPEVSDVRPWHRNPFKYADEPETPEFVPPPPPPPPPEIKPESRFIGTVQQGQMIAVFSFKNDVIPLRQGEVLEDKYTIVRIDPDSVTLEDRHYRNTATLSLGGKK